jgi:flagellar biosynthetic protein FliR
MFLPGFSSTRVPMQIRVFLMLALAGAVVPFASPTVAFGPVTEPLQLISLLTGETFIGAMLAAAVRIFLLAVGFFATAASSAIGMSGQLGASVVDTDAEPALTTLLTMTTLLILFSLDFHHPIIAALAMSYDLLPLGGEIDPSISTDQFVRMLSEGFSNVFRLASPFLIFALLANFYIALVNKLAPNLQLYFVAAPAVIIGGVLLARLVMPVLQPMSAEVISQMLQLP